MEREINVVAKIKDDGTATFVSGDGFTLNIGGGSQGTHLYKHTYYFFCGLENGEFGGFSVLTSDPTPWSGITDSRIPQTYGKRYPAFGKVVVGGSAYPWEEMGFIDPSSSVYPPNIDAFYQGEFLSPNLPFAEEEKAADYDTLRSYIGDDTPRNGWAVITEQIL